MNRRSSVGVRAAAMCCALAMAGTAFAQPRGGQLEGAPYANKLASSFVSQVFDEDGMSRRGIGGPVSTVTAEGGARTAATARELAGRFPAVQRSQVEQAFVESFSAYQKIEAQFGLPRNDIAGAVAAFIAGNYMAYNDVDFPDENFRPLVDQMRGVLANNPVFAGTSSADKRQVYEQMAMVGTFMATARIAFKRNPNPQAERHFRDTARANLEQILKADPDRLRIGGQGLVMQ